FWEKCIPEPMSGCWLWLASRDKDGYGHFRSGSRSKLAHRVSYECLGGAIDGELEIDHLCRNTSCVNPAHLEPVTHLENVRRALHSRLSAHCANGHLYDESNTYWRR